MQLITRKTLTALSLASIAVLGFSGCSMGAASSETAATEAPAPAPSESEEETMEPMADPAANLVGAGCATYAETVPDGPGSVVGMSSDPVAVAASNNPLLKTLTAAVSGQLNPEVNLVDTLNGDEFTVFAPVDDAFAKIDPATIETLKTPEGAPILSTILTYHVVPGQIAPDAIAGTQTTVQGGTVEVAGSGDALTVNGAAVICGGVQTANATVYLIDTVLMPAM
jgi:uncharacterized surface protein with fasciclin (FAS1) repeats